MEVKGQIRVGRIVNNKHPSYEGFIPIVVMTPSSKYGAIGPYCLKDDNGVIMENKWQFQKVYKNVYETKQTYSKWDESIIWQWHTETHIDPSTNEVNDNYWRWRQAGFNAVHAIRYPVGFNLRHTCLYSLLETPNGLIKLNYVEARKQIYVPEYCNAVKKHQMYQNLINLINQSINLLIIEVDGPHQESLGYYQEKYHVDNDFIQNNTILATKDNLNIMLNDEKHPYGKRLTKRQLGNINVRPR